MTVLANSPGVYDPAAVPRPVAGRQVRGLVNQAAAWMRGQGYNITTPLVYTGANLLGTPDGGPQGHADAVRSSDGSVTFGPASLPMVERLAAAVYAPRRVAPVRARSGNVITGASAAPLPPVEAARVLLHELTHQRAQSEGMADSTAFDLLPAFWHRFARGRITGAPLTYGPQVAAFRAQSAQATGHPWMSRPARVWRRDMVNRQEPA